MIKFFLSIFMLILMPMRLLFVLSILLNILLFIAIGSFILKDSYFESAEYVSNVQTKAEKILDRSCSYSIKCSIKLYARGEKDEIKETFFKSINDEKQVKKIGLIEALKAPIQKFFSDNEFNKLLQKNLKESNACFPLEDGSIACEGEEVVAIFKSENCAECNESFKKEFKSLEKRHYKSFLIKLSHKFHNSVFKVFGFKQKDEKIIKEKVKNFVYENL